VCEGKTAVILSAGTELTEGIIQDTHVRFLASELTSMGMVVLRGVQVPDDPAAFQDELGRAVRDACLVIVTGGLGPTADDLTREVVASAAGVGLEFHPEVWEGLLRRFAGRKISDTNRKQAMAPSGFELLPNPNGTAPGFLGSVGDAFVAALPGPPSELRPMFAASVLPKLRLRFGGPGEGDILWGTALMVPESSLEEALKTCSGAAASPSASQPAGLPPGAAAVRWGTRVDEDRIAFSLRGGTAEDRSALFERLVAHLDPIRIRAGDTRPAQALTEALLSSKATLVTAESCTGGLIGKYMTDLPGSSRVYWGGYAAYSYEAKQRLLGVDAGLLERHGAVSEHAVRAMAEGSLAASGADASIAVSGIAGPDGGTPEKPVGTVWIAVGLRGKDCAVRLFSFSGSRDMVRRRTAVAAMLFAESRLRGREFLDTRAKW
jgi:nicotinamide-nucleotide amidase